MSNPLHICPIFRTNSVRLAVRPPRHMRVSYMSATIPISGMCHMKIKIMVHGSMASAFPSEPPSAFITRTGATSSNRTQLIILLIRMPKKVSSITASRPRTNYLIPPGTTRSRFYMSFQDVNSKGIIPGDESRRDAIRVNGSRETGMLRIDYNVGYTITHSNTTAGSGVPFNWGTTSYSGGYAGGGSYFQNRPLYWTIINQPADVNLRNYRNWQTNPFASPDGYFNAYYGNPWWQIDESRLDEKSNDLLGELFLKLKANKLAGFTIPFFYSEEMIIIMRIYTGEDICLQTWRLLIAWSLTFLPQLKLFRLLKVMGQVIIKY